MDSHTPAAVTLTCQDVIGMMLEYLETTLTPATLAAFERHLANCPPCVAYLRTYRRTREVTNTASQVEMPAEMKTRIREFLLPRLHDDAPSGEHGFPVPRIARRRRGVHSRACSSNCGDRCATRPYAEVEG